MAIKVIQNTYPPEPVEHTFPRVMKYRDICKDQLPLIILFITEHDGILLSHPDEERIGNLESGFVSCLNDDWEPTSFTVTLVDQNY